MTRAALRRVTTALLTLFLLAGSAAAGPTKAERCQADKMSEAGKYGFCRLKESAKALKSGKPVDFTKCDDRLGRKWAVIETKGAGECPTQGDEAPIMSQVTGDADDLANALSGFFPNVLDDTMDVEISGIFDGSTCGFPVVVRGPGFTIDRVSGFNGHGVPNDTPGPAAMTPFVFEYAGPCEPALQAALGSPTLTSGSLILRDLAHVEVARWNIYEHRLTAVTAGTEGRMRYTFESGQSPPGPVALLEDGGGGAPSIPSFNPATDVGVEINGVLTAYPVVAPGSATRTLALTFDWQESGGALEWARAVATGANGKQNMSVIRLDATLVELGRTNYFGAFPVSFQLLRGFNLPAKMRVRLVVSYDYSEEG